MIALQTVDLTSAVQLSGGTLLVQCLRDAWDDVSGRMSGLGLWDEDNTCWTGSFLVSSSSYAKSLSGHVLMWSLIVRPSATSWALFGHVQLLAHGLPWDAVSTRVLHYDNGRLRLPYRASRRFPFSMRERLSLFLLGMSESEPGEMAPKSSQVVVLLKFDMHVYTSILTTKELKEAITEYCIPTDLHPRLPPPDLTMNKLSSKYIGIFIEQLKQGGCRVGRRGFFLGRRAIPDAMPWRHIDTGLRDDFPLHYNEDDVARLAEFVIPLRPPPLLTMDAFLKLPVWTGTVVSKDDPIPDGQRPKLRTTPPLAARQPIHEKSPTQKNLEKPNLKIVAAREKKTICKNQEPDRSGSEGTLSPALLHHVGPTNEEEPITIVSNDTVGNATNVKREIVNLSGNTRVTTPSVTVNQPSPRLEHHDTHEHMMVLRNDLRICTFRACKELVSHLATPVEDEFLGSLSNVEVVSRAYQSMGQCVASQSELLKRHKKLNHDYVDLCNHNDAHLAKLDRLRMDIQKAMQANDGLPKKFTLLDTAHSVCSDRERELSNRLTDMKKERDDWQKTASEQGEKAALVAELAQAEVDHHKLVREFIPTVVRKLHTCVVYRKRLATPVSLCFISDWLGSLSLRKNEDQIAVVLSETRELDIEGVKSSEAMHRKVSCTLEHDFMLIR
uniref:Transposase (Putative), gypsy type n=1 Tax=Tanacetum cinerariifolium TaxID=118510 RepID=A0A699HNR1_TANCI|nr:hypothetical protein [Tanacetum cinerariifolium]